MTNIILCGGSGTRLWPISRTLMPKQFVKLIGERSLFQNTYKRNQNICDNFLIVSNENHYFLALDQLSEINIPESKFLLEPIARDTSAAIALACMNLDVADIVLVTPSDHFVKDNKLYEKSILKAKEYAEQDFLVTFGIVPTTPNTGYGYIEVNGPNVVTFHEKPDLETAKRYLSSNTHYWNSGIFCFKAGVFLDELEKYSPNIYNQSKIAYDNAKIQNNAIRIQKKDMQDIDAISIDYLVMEKSKKIKMVSLESGWNDLGSFESLYEELEKDTDQNVISSQNININSTNNLILSSKPVATIDLKDLIIINEPDVCLYRRKIVLKRLKRLFLD